MMRVVELEDVAVRKERELMRIRDGTDDWRYAAEGMGRQVQELRKDMQDTFGDGGRGGRGGH